jgi:hypothetical protein
LQTIKRIFKTLSFYEGTLGIQNFKILSIQFCCWTGICHQICFMVKFAGQNCLFPTLGWNLCERYHPTDVKFQISKQAVLFLDPNLIKKSAFRFGQWWNLLNKTLIFPFWVGICINSEVHNYDWAVLFLNTKFLDNKNAIRFFKIEIC